MLSCFFALYLCIVLVFLLLSTGHEHVSVKLYFSYVEYEINNIKIKQQPYPVHCVFPRVKLYYTTCVHTMH